MFYENNVRFNSSTYVHQRYKMGLQKGKIDSFDVLRNNVYFICILRNLSAIKEKD